MTKINIKIDNLAEIKSAFAKAPVKMAKNIDLAIKASLLTIQRDSMINTPVRTGYLRGSHRTSFTPMRGVLQPMASYAKWVHDGTGRMVARPFLLEAAQSNDDYVQRQFKEAVQATLDSIARDTK